MAAYSPAYIVARKTLSVAMALGKNPYESQIKASCTSVE